MKSRGEICGSLFFIIEGDACMQRMNIKCCHCGDYTPFITEENIEVMIMAYGNLLETGILFCEIPKEKGLLTYENH